MFCLKIFQVILLLTIAILLVSGQKLVPRIDESCLECICQASTQCQNLGCHNDGTSYFCGPYQVTYAYWVDGGKPGADPKNKSDFEVCLKNRICAEQTVSGYMQKWGQDCDNNGYVNCFDFARIHKAGPYGCNGTWALETDYWKLFTECYGTE